MHCGPPHDETLLSPRYARWERAEISRQLPTEPPCAKLAVETQSV